MPREGILTARHAKTRRPHEKFGGLGIRAVSTSDPHHRARFIDIHALYSHVGRWESFPASWSSGPTRGCPASLPERRPHSRAFLCSLSLAGKVHGSLARAGKVRGQTPKVAPQEKGKKPTGRACKRLKYNRRFVNVVTGFGKKRGPNSQ